MSGSSVRSGAVLFRMAGLGLVLGLGLAACGNEPAAMAGMSPQQRVDAAYEAMGGEAIAALKTLSLKAHLGQWDPGESYSLADPDKPGVNSSELIQFRDFENGLVRNEWWDRPKNDDATRRNFYEIVTPMAGWSVGNSAANGRTPKRAIMVEGKPAHTFSGRRLTVTLRELERLNIVPAMRAHPDRVSEIADQMVGETSYPSVQYRSDYGTFIVMFDAATRLPARVRTPDWDALEGDSVFDAEFFDWRDVAGVKIPFRTYFTLNGMAIADLTYRDAVANPALPAGAFDIPPEQLATAAKPTDPRITPFHWAIRRQYSAFYFDSDAMYADDGMKFTMVDIGTNISETQGGTHNTVFIDAGPYLVAMEAPNDDGQSIPSIALAKERYPGKPIRYLVLSHHHVDHVGGMRQYAAQGATIVVGKGNGEYFRRALARPQTQNWNAPENYKTPEVIEVDGKWTAPEATREISFYSLDNPHAAGTLMGYIPDQKLGLVTDIWNPGPPVTASNPNLAAIVHGVEKLGLAPEKFAGGHGTTGIYAQAVAAVRAAEGGRR
jgi:glyoxylase-like metal-dependent hydrolase (beta-lactamase superfamily II)